MTKKPRASWSLSEVIFNSAHIALGMYILAIVEKLEVDALCGLQSTVSMGVTIRYFPPGLAARCGPVVQEVLL